MGQVAIGSQLHRAGLLHLGVDCSGRRCWRGRLSVLYVDHPRTTDRRVKFGALLIVIVFPWCIGGWIILIEADQWFKIMPEQRRLLHSTDHRSRRRLCEC